jgi:hypothetical protein
MGLVYLRVHIQAPIDHDPVDEIINYGGDAVDTAARLPRGVSSSPNFTLTPSLRRRVAMAEHLDHFLVECRNVVGLARSNKLAVGDHLLIDPFGSGIRQIGFQ